MYSGFCNVILVLRALAIELATYNGLSTLALPEVAVNPR